MAESTNVLRSLAGLELAGLRHRRIVRRRLNVGEEELAALLYLAHHGSVPQRRLPEITTLSRSGAGAMIQRLEQDGLVERRSDPADRRLRFIELSALGRERLRTAYHEPDEAVRRLLSGREPEELELLTGFMDALARTAYERLPEEAPPPDPLWRRWG
jgi:DNA-binding MarR family transcriptional regulator